MKKILIILTIMTSLAYSKGKTEIAGDILTLLIPTAAYGTTLFDGNISDQMEFYKSYGSTITLTHILKETVQEQRPNNANSYTSFPSGHTSSAFSGATFIHKKYGLKYAIPAYIGAIYTGYSRVYAKKHYIHDVIAGALLGSGLTWYFTSKKRKNSSITPLVSRESMGLMFAYSY